MLAALYVLALLPTFTLTATNPSLYTATLHYLPTTTPAAPTPLATLLYHPQHPSLSQLTSLNPPPNSTDDPSAITQIAVYHPISDPSSTYYRTSATGIRGFHAPCEGRFRIVVNPDTGEVVGASWRSWISEGAEREAKKGNGDGNGRGDFDITTVKKAPSVVLDMPGKGKGGAAAKPAEGAGLEGEEEVVEKTLLQKYWWLLIGVAVLAMTGGGGDK